jgi:hypothetical protein
VVDSLAISDSGSNTKRSLADTPNGTSGTVRRVQGPDSNLELQTELRTLQVFLLKVWLTRKIPLLVIKSAMTLGGGGSEEAVAEAPTTTVASAECAPSKGRTTPPWSLLSLVVMVPSVESALP